MNRFLTVPLIILVIIAFFALIGVGTTYSSGLFGAISLSSTFDSLNMYYDENGLGKVYYNLTAVGESGYIVAGSQVLATGGTSAYWVNDSSGYVDAGGFRYYTNVFPLFVDVGGANHAVFSYITSNGYNTLGASGISFTSAVGLLIFITLIMGLGTVAGIHLLGSGVSDTSVDIIVKGSGYLALWGVFSALALGLISQIEFNSLPLGYMFYFVLTFFYTVGVIDSFGHPSGGD